MDGAQIAVQQKHGESERERERVYALNESSNRETMWASAATCRACSAEAWNRKSGLYFEAIPLTTRENGSFKMSSSVEAWYFLISRSALVPGRYRLFFGLSSSGTPPPRALGRECFGGLSFLLGDALLSLLGLLRDRCNGRFFSSRSLSTDEGLESVEPFEISERRCFLMLRAMGRDNL